jgi:hypothetical protein
VVTRGEDAGLGEHVTDIGGVVVAEVNDFEREEGGCERRRLEAAEENMREVSVAELTDEVEVGETEDAIGGGGAGGGEVRLVWGCR